MKTQVANLIAGDFIENTLTLEVENKKEMLIQFGKYAIVPINEYNKLVSEANTSREECTLHSVSGLFVLYKTNKLIESFWNGKEWQMNKDNCPTYSWDKANEYAEVMGCSFTDVE